ncbi:MAG: hypothetical protein ACP5LD_10570 [Desulfomonilaceae bacterium]
MSYAQAFSTIGYALVSAFPKSELVRKGVMAASFAAVGADMLASKWAQRIRQEIDGNSNIYLKQAELYRREADKLKMASKYLAEEGSTPETDCFSCATAHLAGMEGALRRAAKESERGKCTPSCQRWVHIADQEPAALFARDWTPEKYEKLPIEQKKLIDKYSPLIEEQMRKIAPTPEGEGVLRAAALLKESIRFAEAGDEVRHPEVEWRRLEAEAELSAVERLRPGTLPPNVAQELRSLRRKVGSGITDTENLIEVAKMADRLSLELNSPAWANMTPKDLEDIAENMRAIRSSFAADRAKLGGLAMISTGISNHHRISKEVVADYTKPGLGPIAGMPSESMKIVFDNVVDRLEERGVKTRFRDLPTTETYSIEGLYDPDNNVITLNASKMSKDSYSLQSLFHESAHALLHNKACHPVISSAEYKEMPEEKEAETVSLATMLELNLPVELWDGTELKPGERKIDWDKLRVKAGPQAEENVRWASDWLVRAARGEDGDLAAEACPALKRPELRKVG